MGMLLVVGFAIVSELKADDRVGFNFSEKYASTSPRGSWVRSATYLAPKLGQVLMRTYVDTHANAAA
jgi:hypothetical protein